jgi:SH3-like domain-containing protein
MVSGPVNHKVAPGRPWRLGYPLRIRGFYLEVILGKRKWRRIRIGNLANAELQERVLRILDQVKVPPEPEFPEKRGSESPQVER